MANRRRDADFTEYVQSKTPWLRRVAFLLCRDWHRADDLVQSAFLRLYLNWDKASRAENFDGYVRTILVNLYLSEQKTPWWKAITLRREQIDETTPDPAAPDPDPAESLDLLAALGAVPPRQRAAIVLRYYCDLSVEETADLLACSPGTVKSQTSRGLAALRTVLETPHPHSHHL
ncbi:MAG TPA: SigE family RNA polymerase sigma factor [Actinocrinis sp.]|nr:SigE family RNA polymerase sigma factor [Actinocrinis sp.]